MNLRRKVWLPPDGDSRLLHFQEDCAALAGAWEAAAVPPYLALDLRGPSGPIRCGAWRFDDDPGLEASDDLGFLGIFRLALPGSPLFAHPERLPPAPPWRWTKGRLGFLVLDQPLGDASFLLWSWESLTGWKAPSKG